MDNSKQKLRMECQNQNLIAPQCAAQSVGAANQLFATLIQTILAAQCAVSPSEKWPKDYGPTAMKHSKFKI